MKRVLVRSRNILSIGYDETTATLEIEFRDGAVYEYYDVPASEHQGLMAARSHGSYLHTHIVGRYRYRRVR